MSAIFSRCC